MRDRDVFLGVDVGLKVAALAVVHGPEARAVSFTTPPASKATIGRRLVILQDLVHSAMLELCMPRDIVGALVEIPVGGYVNVPLLAAYGAVRAQVERDLHNRTILDLRPAQWRKAAAVPNNRSDPDGSGRFHIARNLGYPGSQLDEAEAVLMAHHARVKYLNRLLPQNARSPR